MSHVNGVSIHAPVKGAKKQEGWQRPRLGKPPLPEARRRVLMSVRVLPATLDALEKIGAENPGRAIDELISVIQVDAKMKKACKAARERLGVQDDGIPTQRI